MSRYIVPAAWILSAVLNAGSAALNYAIKDYAMVAVYCGLVGMNVALLPMTLPKRTR